MLTTLIVCLCIGTNIHTGSTSSAPFDLYINDRCSNRQYTCFRTCVFNFRHGRGAEKDSHHLPHQSRARAAIGQHSSIQIGQNCKCKFGSRSARSYWPGGVAGRAWICTTRALD